MSDVLDAVVVELRDDETIAALVGDRVFYSSLPPSEVNNMPRRCVVVTPSGRVPIGADAGYAELERPRFDIKAYGQTPYEAAKVYAAVNIWMKRLTPRTVALDDGDVRLYNAIVGGGPLAMVEPDADWPFVFSSYGIFAASMFDQEEDDMTVILKAEELVLTDESVVEDSDFVFSGEVGIYLVRLTLLAYSDRDTPSLTVGIVAADATPLLAIAGEELASSAVIADVGSGSGQWHVIIGTIQVLTAGQIAVSFQAGASAGAEELEFRAGSMLEYRKAA